MISLTQKFDSYHQIIIEMLQCHRKKSRNNALSDSRHFKATSVRDDLTAKFTRLTMPVSTGSTVIS